MLHSMRQLSHLPVQVRQPIPSWSMTTSRHNVPCSTGTSTHRLLAAICHQVSWFFQHKCHSGTVKIVMLAFKSRKLENRQTTVDSHSDCNWTYYQSCLCVITDLTTIMLDWIHHHHQKPMHHASCNYQHCCDNHIISSGCINLRICYLYAVVFIVLIIHISILTPL